MKVENCIIPVRVEAVGIEKTFSLRVDDRSELAVCWSGKADGNRIKAEIKFSWPILDICGLWYPNCQKERSLQADWSDLHKSMTCVSAPVMCLYDETGENRLTFAFEEAVKEVYFGAGVREEDGTLSCVIELELEKEEIPYNVKLWMNWERVPFYEVLEQAAIWWEEDCGMKPMPVPETAKLPMYSSWYAYHQNITAKELEKEAKLAKEFGFSTMIVDDGWQTADNNRGYAFCGDNLVTPEKIPDMKEHVKRIHEIGLKYMIWYSVPFVGISSEAWKRFGNKILWYDTARAAGVLDIRYPEVRAYLMNFYRRTVEEWDMDGLKLDFVDEFFIREGHEVPVKPGMDFKRVEDALLHFLGEIRVELQRIKADVMIEFRQWYVGPRMRCFGNIIRVTDCPLSAMNNRIGSVDIRLLSRNTAVHSDMIMWHNSEKAEDAARQIINSLFADLQLSVKLEEQTAEMQKMIRFWVHFIAEKRNVLQNGKLKVCEPHNLYPEVTAWKEKEAITAVYSAGRRAVLHEDAELQTFVNGTKQEEIIIDFGCSGEYEVCQRNCLGEILCSEKRKYEEGIHLFSITPSGMLEFRRCPELLM